MTPSDAPALAPTAEGARGGAAAVNGTTGEAARDAAAVKEGLGVGAPAFTIRPVKEEEEEAVRSLLREGFQSNVKAFYWAIASGLKVPMAGLLVGCAGAAVASPKNAPTIAAAGASLAALAAGGMLLWFKSKHRALQRASMADDLGCIASYYTEERQGPGTGFWVAVSNSGDLLGCVGLQRRTEERAEFRRLAVSLKARRMGIARALTAHAVAAARAAGVRTMFLSTSTAQHAACTMYERDGWKVVSTKAVPVLDLRIVRFELQLKA
uniref:N-acetyltransferase domain-containing protein n=1 Tax=Chlamydomonas euryale TaxID=1486919 RepID=A0A7R9YXN3_9CHLO|mmetsp:Transcript_34403/g.102197  ORF Transcript_34403/g.102197 Transcript_34403/m.102197 type:complete len:267 (+) Transcript_34403:524-1324(+)